MRLPENPSWAAALLGVGLLAGTSQAGFHDTRILQILTSYDGDASAQAVTLVEMSPGSPPAIAEVAHGVIAAFGATGTYLGDVIEFPADVPISGFREWLVATPVLETVTGVTPDFAMTPGTITTGGGMLCYGGGAGSVPQNPATWDRTDFANYHQCVAYGSYAGPENAVLERSNDVADGRPLYDASAFSDPPGSWKCAHPFRLSNGLGEIGVFPGTVVPCGIPLERFGRLLMKRTASGREKLTFRSLFDWDVSSASPDNPADAGATVEIFSPTEGVGTLTVPPGLGLPGWKVNPQSAGEDAFIYTNRDAPAGPSPVKRILVKPGNGPLKIVAKSIGLPMALPHGTIGIRITWGLDMYCGVFVDPSFDQPGVYKSSDFVAFRPTLPDCLDATLLSAP